VILADRNGDCLARRQTLDALPQFGVCRLSRHTARDVSRTEQAE
jgi:hypothetical protein